MNENAAARSRGSPAARHSISRCRLPLWPTIGEAAASAARVSEEMPGKLARPIPARDAFAAATAGPACRRGSWPRRGRRSHSRSRTSAPPVSMSGRSPWRDRGRAACSRAVFRPAGRRRTNPCSVLSYPCRIFPCCRRLGIVARGACEGYHRRSSVSERPTKRWSAKSALGVGRSRALGRHPRRGTPLDMRIGFALVSCLAGAGTVLAAAAIGSGVGRARSGRCPRAVP